MQASSRKTIYLLQKPKSHASDDTPPLVASGHAHSSVTLASWVAVEKAEPWKHSVGATIEQDLKLRVAERVGNVDANSDRP